MRATSQSRLDEYPEDYPWTYRQIGCEDSRVHLGVLLVDQSGVPQFIRARCKGGRCKAEGLLTFHVFDLIRDESFTFTHPYRTST